MTFQPAPGLIINIQKKNYKLAEHPTVPGIPYGQEGRRAVVYQLTKEDDEKFALKVFKDKFRAPGMVSIAELLEPYATLPGLQACDRIVLTASKHRELLNQIPELTYAVLMPWVEGPTWQELLLSDENYSPERALSLTKSFAEILVRLEENRLAHCDLSGANLIIQPGDLPGLVDLEEMSGPGFLKPKEIPAGSSGYAHKTAPQGLWSDEADRFAGAVLLVEMLCWFDPVVREAAWGESYFSPRDMQNENEKLDLLQKSLETHYGIRILDLFNQAWRSDSLRGCPTFAEWAVALPEKIKEYQPKDQTHPLTGENYPDDKDALSYYLDGQSAADRGEYEKSHSLYQKAITIAGPELSRDIEQQMKLLEDKIKGEEEPLEQPEPTTEENRAEEYPVRFCPACGLIINKAQEICPHCGEMGIFEQKEIKKPTRKRWRIWLWGGIITAAIAGVLMGLFILITGDMILQPLSALNNPIEANTWTRQSVQTTSTPRPRSTSTPAQTPNSIVYPTSNLKCIKWSKITRTYLGREICIYGVVRKVVLDDYFALEFGSSWNDFKLLDVNNVYWPDVKAGDCIMVKGEIRDNVQYIYLSPFSQESATDLYIIDQSECNK